MKKNYFRTGYVYLAFMCSFLLPGMLLAQSYNKPQNANWIAGVKFKQDVNMPLVAGLTFTKDTAVARTYNPEQWEYVIEGTTAVSDSKGKLLFYTDGWNVIDRTDSVMPNGDNISPGWNSTGESSWTVAQGSLIVPIPGDPHRYYVFNSTAFMFWIFYGGPGSLYYSIVDMRLNNGKGDIVSGSKSLFLSNGLGEQLVGIPGSNCNVWVLTTRTNQNVYEAYEVNGSGLRNTPVVSTSGSNVNPYSCMAVSHNLSGGKYKVAVVNDPVGITISDFDVVTGMVSNSVKIDSAISYYGLCFSPDNSKLYATAYEEGGKFIQFNLSDKNAKVVIDSGNDRVGQIQAAPNGKLYTVVDEGPARPMIGALHVVNDPDKAGTACNYKAYGQPLTLSEKDTNYYTLYGLHNLVPVVNTNDTLVHTLDSLICGAWPGSMALKSSLEQSEINYLWNTGDTTTAITATEPGTYWVAYTNGCEHHVDSFIIKQSEISATISINVFELGVTGGPFVSYQWYYNGNLIPGANGATYSVTANGDYRVEVTNDAGCVYLSDVYTVTNWETSVDQIDLEKAILIYPNPSEDILQLRSPVKLTVMLYTIDGRLLARYRDMDKVYIGHLSAGMYLVRFLDQKGRIVKTDKLIKE